MLVEGGLSQIILITELTREARFFDRIVHHLVSLQSSRLLEDFIATWIVAMEGSSGVVYVGMSTQFKVSDELQATDWANVILSQRLLLVDSLNVFLNDVLVGTSLATNRALICFRLLLLMIQDMPPDVENKLVTDGTFRWLIVGAEMCFQVAR